MPERASPRPGTWRCHTGHTRRVCLPYTDGPMHQPCVMRGAAAAAAALRAEASRRTAYVPEAGGYAQGGARRRGGAQLWDGRGAWHRAVLPDADEVGVVTAQVLARRPAHVGRRRDEVAAAQQQEAEAALARQQAEGRAAPGLGGEAGGMRREVAPARRVEHGHLGEISLLQPALVVAAQVAAAEDAERAAHRTHGVAAAGRGRHTRAARAAPAE
eukprot:scaffold29466_cov57-Phaeocystis_antarctica.AAC.2